MNPNIRCLVCKNGITSEEHQHQAAFCYYALHNRLMDLKNAQEMLRNIGIGIELITLDVTKDPHEA